MGIVWCIDVQGWVSYGVLMYKGGYRMVYYCTRVGIVWYIDVQGCVLYDVLMYKDEFHMVY